ncbi:MAG TPA: hypothetical protein VIJ92_09410 [Ginsengibacter sp.]
MSFFKNLKITVLKRQFILLLFLWAVVQALLIRQYGIVTNLEATKYIDEANHLLQFGKFNTNNHYLYSTQIFLIAGVIKLHLGFSVIVVVQLLLNLLATVMFYKLSNFFLKKPLLATGATLFFIINIPYQLYTGYLFTESIFYSLTIIYSSYVLRLEKLTSKDWLFILLFATLLSITRPTGILFFAVTLLYIFFRFLNNLGLLYKIITISVALAIFLVAINSMLQAGGSLDFMLPFKKENIICGVNTVNNADINTLEKGNSIQGIVYYMFNNKEQFLRLARLKTLAFFGMLRTYYSLSHNILLALFFYPFYILSFVGVWKKIKQRDTAIIYIISIILLYWVTTLLTCDDWHNRFVLTVSPFLFLLGFASFIKKDSASKEFDNVHL